MASPIAQYPKTGIRVIIVGAGFGGLTAAIECTLKGHTAIIVEKTPTFEQLGDIISISTNAGRIMSRWDPALIEEKLRPAAMPPNRERPMYNGHRADIHKVFYEYAKSLGVEFNMGQKVTGYKEDAASGKAWIETESGEIFKGDVVVGADGVRSRARKLILGYEDKPRSSGYSVWRAWFNAEENGVTTDPLTKEFVENGDTHTGWLGDDMHLLVASCKGGKEISWVCTRKDDSNLEESWSSKGKVEDVLNRIKDWDPKCRAIVSKSPSCMDWKLVCRDPLPTWVSPTGHTCLLGDAAHPFLPTSVQGCSQAIEDGSVLATCLSLSHQDSTIPASEKIPRALRAYERLRYERVKSAQKTGEDLRDKWHKCDYKTVHLNPESIRMPREDWLIKHDSERFVRRMWGSVAAELTGGPVIPRKSLAAGRESDEKFDNIELPPTPISTPKEELANPLR
ncbi:uncharacterized protein LAJ45_05968 [Morchella importuna]|uniref:uncharacterized protein n=1 Tax=Morchella importuna TaxID=1174673 RepID=UPI001E8D256D|nr:uncharacterized protein LAJ45_05968 [Morchella importuna]KAH8149816.1 hypothetical protein LAJ45_05968 [Morchella importuna]